MSGFDICLRFSDTVSSSAAVPEWYGVSNTIGRCNTAIAWVSKYQDLIQFPEAYIIDPANTLATQRITIWTDCDELTVYRITRNSQQTTN